MSITLPYSSQEFPDPTVAQPRGLDEELTELRKENQLLSELYEETISRTHSLTMEAEIARLEFEQIFNAFGDASWVVNHDYGVLKINKAFLDLLGLEDKQQALFRKCYDLLPSRLCRSADCPMKQMRMGKKQVVLDGDIDFSEEKKIPFLITTPMEPDHDPVPD